MKKSVLTMLALVPAFAIGQTFTQLSTDPTGDDHSFSLDATGLSYAFSQSNDSLYVKITHDNPRGGDFGFALALDTNLTPTDGHAINQTNMVASPNNSMQYDILLYAYQNGTFPTVYTEAYGPSGNIINLNYSLDTVDSHFSTFRIPLTALDGKKEFNLIGFVGSFDISASGPSDAVPNSTFSEIRTSNIGLEEKISNFSIYPNPASQSFRVTQSGLMKILTENGKLIYQASVNKNQKVDCSHLPAGVYFLQFDDTQLPQKLLIY